MARVAREKSGTRVYHIIQRGINRQVIFHETEDFERYLSTIERYKKECQFKLYGYCLMSNHIHLLVKETSEIALIGEIIKKISDSYVFWYNKKYLRTGHLFDGRFKSEPVESDEYLLTVIRYIHQNPIKAYMVDNIGDYRWSSYYSYLYYNSFVDSEFILRILNGDGTSSTTEYTRFMASQNMDSCLEVDTSLRITDTDLEKEIMRLCDLRVSSEFRLNHLVSYAKDLNELILKYTVSDRQLSRVTGLSRHVMKSHRGTRPHG